MMSMNYWHLWLLHAGDVLLVCYAAESLYNLKSLCIHLQWYKKNHGAFELIYCGVVSAHFVANVQSDTSEYSSVG